ncbi:MAG: hypothetical protein HYZ20_07855 [Burkholderiales bacterium]|nr:hypothetical protein [Burkholderiales bacterium]
MAWLLAAAAVLAPAAAQAASAAATLDAEPAWRGWSRPGRTTEVDLRIAGGSAARATFDVVAGAQSLHGTVDLVPGQTLRVRLPLPAARHIVAELQVMGGAALRRELTLSWSESPLLAVALAGSAGEAGGSGAAGEAGSDGSAALAAGPALPRFHAIAVGAADLPQHAPAFASVDALLVDATTLAALQPAQLDALLGHAAGCGRIGIVGAGEELQRMLRDAAGCGGAALVFGATATQAVAALDAALAARLPAALPATTLDALAPADPGRWQQAAAALAVAAAVLALAAVFAPALPVLLTVAAASAGALLGLPRALPPLPQLVVWGEADAGAGVARYQALQRVAGTARGTLQVPLPRQLAPSVRGCDAGMPLRLTLGAARAGTAAGAATPLGAGTGAVAVAAAFDTRLLQRTALCYAGRFPLARALAVEPGSDGAARLRNTGARELPAGRVVAAGQVHEMPTLAPGSAAALAPGRAPRDAVERLALARTPAGGAAALWPLELGGVEDLPVDASGWLLVQASVR